MMPKILFYFISHMIKFAVNNYVFLPQNAKFFTPLYIPCGLTNKNFIIRSDLFFFPFYYNKYFDAYHQI